MTATDKEIVLITGANVGLGLEIANKLLRDHEDRFYILVGCRTLSKGEAAVKELHNQGLTECEVIQIEVTDDASIARAAETVENKFGRLDVLHANVSSDTSRARLSKGKRCSQPEGRHSARQRSPRRRSRPEYLQAHHDNYAYQCRRSRLHC